MTYITSLDPQPAVLLLEILGGAIGPMGPQGPVGPPNAGVFIKGIAGTWPPAANPAVGDLYIVPDPSPTDEPPWVKPGHGAFWDGAAWLDAGLLRGPTGLRGEPGPPLRVRGIAQFWPPDLHPSPGDIWSLPDPPPPGTPPEYAKEGAAGWDAATGQWIQLSSIRGPAGRSVEVYGPSQLPPSPTNTVLYKGDLWLSDGSYPAGGSFDPSLVTPGAKGDKGDPGQAGTIRIVGTVTEAAGTPASVTNEGTASAAELRFHIPQGPQGIQGLQGVAGNAGPQGPAGDTFKVSGAVANEASLPGSPPNLAVYITQVDSHLHIYDPSSAAAKPSGYVDLGAIAGPQGASAFVSSPVVAVADLPAGGSAGQMIVCLTDGHIYGWDAAAGKWVDGGMIRGPQGVAGHGTIEDGTADKQIAVWSVTNGRWEGADNTLQGLKDVRFPALPVDGQVLTWKTDHWEALDASGASPIVFMGSGAWDNTAPVDGSDPMYGMPAGTTPTPIEYPPIPGDSYIDLTTGKVTTFTGALANKRKAAAITGGGGPLDIIREKLSTLDDVDLTTTAPKAQDVLGFNGTKWVPKPGVATQQYVNLKVEQLSIGLAHSVAVQGIENNPPANPQEGVYYIVGTAPAGDWAGNANSVAYYGLTSGGSFDWHFVSPAPGEAHLVEDEQATYSWNGTLWVKVGAQGQPAIEQLSNVSHNTKANYDILVYHAVSNSWLGMQSAAVTSLTHYTKAEVDAKVSVVGAASLYQLGDIKQSILTESQFRTMMGAEADKWVLADGRDVTASDYHTLTGNTRVPDLRASFLRMAGQNNNPSWTGPALNTYQEDSTRLPRSNSFTGTTNNTGGHIHGLKAGAGSAVFVQNNPQAMLDGERNWSNVSNATASNVINVAGSHDHSVNIDGGGDTETRPKCYGVNFFIKVKV